MTKYIDTLKWYMSHEPWEKGWESEREQIHESGIDDGYTDHIDHEPWEKGWESEREQIHKSCIDYGHIDLQI